MATIIDLSTLISDQGYSITGDAAGDHAGESVSSAGDVNGDGFDDVIVGAYGNDAGGAFAGAAYVIFGKADGFGAIDLGALAPADGFVIEGGAAGDLAGAAVSSAGDINGDGFNDIIVGAPENGAGAPKAGAAYVIFGKAGGLGAIDLGDFAPAEGFMILGATSYGRAGASVSSAGDVNGDGLDDMIIGAPTAGHSRIGAAYVIFGKTDGFDTIDLDDLAPADGFTIKGASTEDFFGNDTASGCSVSTAGDVNGDGFDDMIIGAYGYDNVLRDSGAAFVVFGKAGGFDTIDLENLAPAEGFLIKNMGVSDRAGDSVSDAGDINGDGFDDVIVGAVTKDAGAREAGAAWVIFGKADGFGTIDVTNLAPEDGFLIQGAAKRDFAGGDVSSAGDVNGDGFDDLIVGANGNDAGGDYAGAAYVIFGKARGLGTIDLADLAPEDGFIIQGASAQDFLGVSVSLAGDVNNDGFADLIVGGDQSDDGGDQAGAAYVIFGSAPTEAVIRIGSAIGQTIRGGVGDDRLAGRGGDDVLIGADGDDRLGGDAGGDRLVGEAGVDVMSGGGGADRFVFGEGDTGRTARTADTITDFSRADNDRIDLSAIDAIIQTPGDEAFAFIGDRAFSGEAGELRYRSSGGDTLLIGDTDGDRAADLVIRLTGSVALDAMAFVSGETLGDAFEARTFAVPTDLHFNHMICLI